MRIYTYTHPQNYSQKNINETGNKQKFKWNENVYYILVYILFFR